MHLLTCVTKFTNTAVEDHLITNYLSRVSEQLHPEAALLCLLSLKQEPWRQCLPKLVWLSASDLHTTLQPHITPLEWIVIPHLSFCPWRSINPHSHGPEYNGRLYHKTGGDLNVHGFGVEFSTGTYVMWWFANFCQYSVMLNFAGKQWNLTIIHYF